MCIYACTHQQTQTHKWGSKTNKQTNKQTKMNCNCKDTDSAFPTSPSFQCPETNKQGKYYSQFRTTGVAQSDVKLLISFLTQ
jgi:hypothetical protein